MFSHTYLSQFKSISPQFAVEQSKAREWLRYAYGRSLDQAGLLNEAELELWTNKYTVNDEQIHTRFTELEDFTRRFVDDNEIFKINEDHQIGVGLEARMRFFERIVSQRALSFYENQSHPPDHIIHVSCTGYISPSPVQRLCSTKSWHKTEITHAYHMGCYAAMPAIRMADAQSKASQKSVDVFHSELCTLHFSTDNFSPEQLIVQSLFADGYIGYKCSPNAGELPSLKIIAIGEVRVAGSEEDMTWVPGDKNFKMTISKDVPLKLASKIHEGLEEIFVKANVDRSSVMKNAVFAIHPGGPKILDQVSMLLELQEQQITESREVLFEKGNMSSATLPHIWQKILDNPKHDNGQKVVSLAFGPGLSLFGAVFEITK